MNYLIFITCITLGALLSYWLRKKIKQIRLNRIRKRERYLEEKKEIRKRWKAEINNGLCVDFTPETFAAWEEADKLMAMNPEEQKAYTQERERKSLELWQEARRKELKKLDRGDNIPLTPEEKKRKIMIEEAIERNK